MSVRLSGVSKESLFASGKDGWRHEVGANLGRGIVFRKEVGKRKKVIHWYDDISCRVSGLEGPTEARKLTESLGANRCKTIMINASVKIDLTLLRDEFVSEDKKTLRLYEVIEAMGNNVQARLTREPAPAIVIQRTGSQLRIYRTGTVTCLGAKTKVDLKNAEDFVSNFFLSLQ